MLDPEYTIERIPQELDKEGWNLEYDKTYLRVYSLENASDSGLVGFKTVTEHLANPSDIVAFLKEVCSAMEQMNDLYAEGGVLREWPSPMDPQGQLVRTAFKMPFPMKNRSFVHGIHSVQTSENCWIVGYTPTEARDVPVLSGYHRCGMYVSGQRITKLPSGLVRVEHLMVYALGGSIPTGIQDRFFKSSHVGAYIKEWRGMGRQFFPPQRHQLDPDTLKVCLLAALQKSSTWPSKGKGTQGFVSVGELSYCPHQVYRLDIDLEGCLETITHILADASLEFLPQWNREFMNGQIVEVIEETSTRSAWVLEVNYKTPSPLNHRSYYYYFSREWISKDEVLISYQSIKNPKGPSSGFEQALLYPSLHFCKRLEGNRTRVVHLLATSLGGKLARYQDGLLQSSLIKAQYRDMENQVALLTKKPHLAVSR